MVDFARCSVECDNGEAFVVHVQDQVLTLQDSSLNPTFKNDNDRTAYHDGQANKADITAEADVSTRSHDKK